MNKYQDFDKLINYSNAAKASCVTERAFFFIFHNLNKKIFLNGLYKQC